MKQMLLYGWLPRRMVRLIGLIAAVSLRCCSPIFRQAGYRAGFTIPSWNGQSRPVTEHRPPAWGQHRALNNNQTLMTAFTSRSCCAPHGTLGFPYNSAFLALQTAAVLPSGKDNSGSGTLTSRQWPEPARHGASAPCLGAAWVLYNNRTSMTAFTFRSCWIRHLPHGAFGVEVLASPAIRGRQPGSGTRTSRRGPL